MSQELSNENSPVKMTEEEYFNKASAAFGNPEKLAELKKLNVEIVGNQEVNATPPVKEEEKQVEEQPTEKAEEAPKKEEKAKEQPFDKDAEALAKETSTPKQSDEATSVAPSSDEVGTLRSELDAVKKDRDEWRHKFTSNAGRIAAYQKTIADLKNQVTLLQGDSRQPAAAKSADASKAKPKESPTLKKLESVDPTLAEVLKEYREEIETDLKSEFEGGLKNTNKVILETQNRDFLEKEHAKLRSVVTNLDEVISSKEFAYFRDNVASPAVQKLLESDFADDALVGLEIYETWCDRVVSAKKGDPKSEPKEEIKEEPKKEEPKPKEDLKKVIEARDRRLNATDVSSTPPTPKGSGEFDPEALFNEAFNKRLSKVMPTKR